MPSIVTSISALSGAGRIAGALAVVTLLLGLAAGCGSSGSSSAPAVGSTAATDQTNARMAHITRDAIYILRRLNVENLAFLRDGSPPGDYRVALDFLVPEIQALSQQVVDITLIGSGGASDGLLAAVDPLTRAASGFRRYVDAGDEGALAAAYDQLTQAHAQLGAFLETTALPDAPALRDLYQQAGRVDVSFSQVEAYRIALGPFANEEEARDAVNAAASFGAAVEEDDPVTVWLAPLRVASEAQAAAAQWQDRGVPAAIHVDTIYEFSVSELAPVQGRTWREHVWSHVLDWPAQFIALSPDGGAVLVGDTGGTIERRTAQGELQWIERFSLPTFAMAATREGNGIFAAGVGAQFLGGDGVLAWHEALDAYDVILERAAVGSQGQFMVAATSNEGGMGQVFGFDRGGLAWVTPGSLGVNSFDLASNGTPVALGANGEGRFHVLVLNDRGEKQMGADLAEPVIGVTFAGIDRKLVVLTDRHVSQFDIATQRIEWQESARGRALTVSQPGDIIYVGGAQGITAFYQDGRRLWTQDAMSVTRIVANRDYLIGLSEDIRLVVLRFDGSILGAVSPLAPIRDFAVATDGSLLVALDHENRLFAWLLPPPDQ